MISKEGELGMKVKTMVSAIALLCLSSTALSYESYDYTPMDNGYYYEGGDDNNAVNQYEDENNYAHRQDHQRSYKRNYASNKKAYAGAGKTFVFDPKSLQWYAYNNGELINSGRASGGRHYCPDIRRGCKTPVGVFRVGAMGGPGCKSSKYPVGKGNAPMPYCMFFHGGYAIHGSGSVPGYNASHGCIRVQPQAARWLSQNFIQPGTRVVVKGYR
jgi:hypothetical protein